MRKFATLMLVIVSVSMICGFVFGILYSGQFAEIYVTPNNEAYMQIAGQVFVHEFE